MHSKTITATTCASILAIVFVATPTSAQTDGAFRSEVLQRLERIERLLQVSAGSDPARGTGSPNGIRAASTFTCANDAQCIRYATNFCVTAGFKRGVPLRQTSDAYVTRVTEVTCF